MRDLFDVLEGNALEDVVNCGCVTREGELCIVIRTSRDRCREPQGISCLRDCFGEGRLTTVEVRFGAQLLGKGVIEEIIASPFDFRGRRRITFQVIVKRIEV